jgi:transposase InsO family protein
VTQWQNLGCVETISERHVLPVLEAIPHQFPFQIAGFHSDNGSEFLNHRVARLMNKWLIEFTKSRACRTTDNALVEGKNGAIVRKHIGYGFNRRRARRRNPAVLHGAVRFNPYLNFHRPCGFAALAKDQRGRISRRYPADDYRTPFEKLCSLDHWQQHLKLGTSEAFLRARAMQRSDTEAAREMQKAKLGILRRVRIHF